MPVTHTERLHSTLPPSMVNNLTLMTKIVKIFNLKIDSNPFQGHSKIVKYLLGEDSNIMAKTREGFTVLYISIRNNHENVVKEIFDYLKKKSELKNALLLAESKAGILIQILMEWTNIGFQFDCKYFRSL